MADVLTTALAILGSITGVSSLAVETLTARRERSQLRFKVDVQTIIGRPPRVVIDIFNDSPRATTVREVGLYARPVRVSVAHAAGGESAGYAEIDFPFSDQPFFMEANEMRRFAGFPDIFSHGIHADMPLRAYAVDGRNRRTWETSAGPYCRHMLGDRPPIEEDDAEGLKRLMRTDGIERSPWPVEPRWKLWKPRDMRRWSDEAVDVRRQQRTKGTLRVRGFVQHFDPDERATPQARKPKGT